MRPLAVACAAVCLSVGSRAADAAWFDNYAQVAQDIATHGFDSSGGLPQGFTLAVPTPEPSGKIRMQYNFAWNDPVFGTNAGGLLSSTTVGSAGYNLHLIKDVAERPSTITLPKSTSSYTQGALPWLSVAGTRLAYMQARTDQWDLGLRPFDTSPLNPWRRNAAVVGMAYDTEQRVTGGNYANNYVVTFDIDPQYVLRPNANQLVSIGTAASAPMTLNQLSQYDIDASWSQAWSPAAATPTIYNHGGTINTSLSDLLRSQWDDNTLTKAFPFTGIGYTYDWYYQDRSKWTDGEGVGLAEFIAMPSTDAYDVVVDIVSVQTTAQFLGASAAFPNVTPVPEPAMTLPAALAASLFLANRLFRQRRVDRRAKKEAFCNGLETLEPRLPLDASGGLPSLDFAREVRISSSLVGPDPLLFSKSELVGHGTGGFVVSAVAAGATVEKWDEATDQWRDVSTPPESGNPRELLSLLQNRVVREGDRLRWVPAAGEGAVREAFAIIGWDAAGAAAEPDTTGAPGPVQDLTIDVTDNDIQVSWTPPSGGAAATHYTVATHWRDEAPGSGHEAVAGVVTLLPASQTSLRVPYATAPLGDGSSQFLVGVHAHGAEGTSDVTTAQTSVYLYLKLFPGLTDGVPFPVLDVWGEVPSWYDGPNPYPGAQLSGLDMHWLDLTNADLNGADLSHANLENAVLTGANLFNADLSNAYLAGFDNGVHLSNANLAWANLSGADVDNADLTNANFMGANLSGARLYLNTMDGALFMGVDLSNTDLVTLFDANAYYDERTVFPADYDPVEFGWIKVIG